MTKEEQAIEYIKGYRKLDEKLYNTAPKGTVSSIATKKCLEFWDMAIKALEQTTWIPCSERLPEEDRDVLVQMADDSMMVDCRAASSSGWFWAEKDDLPVAWMPLPEPYKVEPQESEDKE